MQKLTTAPVPVDSLRNVDGFAFGNTNDFESLVGGYTLGNWAEVFGDQQYFVAFVDPVADIIMGIADGALQDGQCFGFALASFDLNRAGSPMASFPAWDGINFTATRPGPARDVWHLRSPLDPSCDGKNAFTSSCVNHSPDLAHYIHMLHLRQISTQMLQIALGRPENSFSSLRSDAIHALDAGGGLVFMNSGVPAEGHVVRLYGMRDNPDRGMTLDVYDPDVPFGLGEDAENGSTHATALGESQIVMTPDGHWKYNNGRNNGANFDMSRLWISITTPDVFDHVDFPAGLGIVQAILGSVSGASVRQITDGAGHQMFTAAGAYNEDPRTWIPRSTIFPIFGGLGQVPTPPVFVHGNPGAYTYQIDGAGEYTVRMGGPAYAAEMTVGAGAGSGDQVTVDPRGVFELRTTAAQRALRGRLVVRQADKTERVATIEPTAFREGPSHLEWSADHEEVTYTHGGAPGLVKLELSTNKTRTSRLVAVPMQVEKGDVVTFRPNWSALEGGAGTVVLRKATGAVITRAIH